MVVSAMASFSVSFISASPSPPAMAENWPRSRAREHGRWPTGVAPTGGTGIAAQYQVSVFNFAPTWDQFDLISPRRQFSERSQFLHAALAARLAQGCP